MKASLLAVLKLAEKELESLRGTQEPDLWWEEIKFWSEIIRHIRAQD